VHQGVSLEAFLHAYRAALFGYWDACAEEASRLDICRAAGLALARFALDAIDTVTTHAAEAYLREETRVRTQSGREARDLIERLIRGQPIADHRRHPAAPGLDPPGRDRPRRRRKLIARQARKPSHAPPADPRRAERGR
jgi:hypothetical protein